MSRKDEARPHLAKAEEYVDAAGLVMEYGRYNAACSLAVTAGINSKDVICILSVGYTDKSDNHGKAVDDLRKSGPIGKRMTETLRKLLGQKTKSQYSPASVSATDADAAVKRAERLFDAAKELFSTTAR